MSQRVSLMGQRPGRPAGARGGRRVSQGMEIRYHRYAPAEVWTPAINLYEDRTHFLVVVDLAGVLVEEIDLRVGGDVLVVAGRREAPGLPDASGGPGGPGGAGEKCVHVMEVDHGRFRRQVDLPRDVDEDAVEASYRCGYLWIRLPKQKVRGER